MSGAAQHAVGGDDLSTGLEEIRSCLQEAWPEGCPALDALARLDERLRMSRLQVAVLGQFKRGKSTFINALLGSPLLPSAVVPATAIPTFIAWGPVLLIRVTYLGNRPADEIYPATPSEAQEVLRQWVTEDGNPENRRGVARVDLLLPAAILRDGMVVIDTPGIGSTLLHNTDAALQVLPECDAALFLLSADPPITEAELAYLAKVRRHAVRLFFVLNKTDYLSQPELAEVIAFLQSALRRGQDSGTAAPILPLSARQALAAVTQQDGAAREASGLGRIERDVLAPLAREKVTALRVSVRSKALAILEQALADLALRIRTLELPLEDLARRARALQDALRATASERQAARDLLDGDRRRAIADLESQAEQLRREGNQHLNGVVARAIAQNSGILDPAAVQQALEAAIPVFFENRLADMAAAFRRSVEEMLARHQERADVLVASIRQTASAIFDLPASHEAATEPFRLGPAPYWVTQGWSKLLMPSPASLLARALPGKLRQAHLHRQVAKQVGALVQQNVENLRWATLQGVNDTFRRFSAQLDERLAEVLAVTEGVIGAALARRRVEEGQTTGELQRLRVLAERLADLRAQFARPAGI
jgi:GTP-binding protein EngB required for normal cell division